MTSAFPSSVPAVEVFFDGDCPLCRREVALVRRLDRRARIRFTDIAAPGFDARTVGRTQADLMARIQGRLPDGTFVEGVEVFRRMYAAAGLAPLVALTRLPGISHLLDACYRWFAKNRLRLTGRCDSTTCAPSAHRDHTTRQELRQQLENSDAGLPAGMQVLHRGHPVDEVENERGARVEVQLRRPKGEHGHP